MSKGIKDNWTKEDFVPAYMRQFRISRKEAIEFIDFMDRQKTRENNSDSWGEWRAFKVKCFEKWQDHKKQNNLTF